MNAEDEEEYRKYVSQLELALASLETRSTISTFLAGSIYVIISLAIINPQKFVATEHYILLLFVGAMLLTFSSIFYFETSSTAKSAKVLTQEFEPHLKKVQNLSRFGDILYAFGTLFFMLANVWMIGKFGWAYVVIAAVIVFSLFFILVMKR